MSSTCPPPDNQRGFSLLEILVAFSILALVLTLALRLFSTSLRSAGQSADVSRALLHARSRLAAVSALPLRPGHDSGTFADGDHWQTDVRRWQDPAPDAVPSPLPIYRIRVDVSWNDGRTHHLSLSTLRVPPGVR